MFGGRYVRVVLSVLFEGQAGPNAQEVMVCESAL